MMQRRASVLESRSPPNRRKISGQTTIVCALPLYHVFAFVTCGLLGMRTGALNMLDALRMLDPAVH